MAAFSCYSSQDRGLLPLCFAFFDALRYALLAGAAVRMELSWATVPLEVIRRAFELQSDGYDNCAASASCKAWRAAIAGSAADSICLCATTDSQEQRWQRLLSSRCGIKRLKLVRAAAWSSSNDWYTLLRSEQTAKATLDSIPTACRSLTLSEFCSHHLALYVQKAPQLEQLSFDWGALPLKGLTELQRMPKLSTLSCLTELEVKMRNDVHGGMVAELIKHCPYSLQILRLHAFGYETECEEPHTWGLQTLDLLEHYLPALTQLQFEDCALTIPGDDITCLSKLSSLSLKSSLVYWDKAPHFEHLMALTYLDLTSTLCHWQNDRPSLHVFTAGPGLLVLKTSDCTMFNRKTHMVLNKIKEIHMNGDSLLEITSTSQLQLHLRACLPLFEHQPLLSMLAGKSEASQKLLAELILYADREHGQNAIQGCMHEISSNFPELRLLLPTSLHALSFTGFGLFKADVQHNLFELSCLSKVMLSFVRFVAPCGALSWPSMLPELPSCVHQLELPTSAMMQGVIDWTNSSGCEGVRHVTLQSPPDDGCPLDEWVRSLPSLSVIDYIWYDSLRKGTRLPGVCAIPNWLHDPRLLRA